MTDKLLSDKEVRQLAGRNSRVVLYPDISNYNNIDELFGRQDKLIILYINEESPNSVTGHWVALLRNKRNGKTYYEVNDSYGKEIDEHLDSFPKSYRETLQQKDNFLTRLLYKKLQEDKNSVVEYNEMAFQSSKPDIATCGRYAGVRAHFHDIPLEQYQDYFKKLKKEKYNLDHIIVELSDKLLNV